MSIKQAFAAYVETGNTPPQNVRCDELDKQQSTLTPHMMDEVKTIILQELRVEV